MDDKKEALRAAMVELFPNLVTLSQTPSPTTVSDIASLKEVVALKGAVTVQQPAHRPGPCETPACPLCFPALSRVAEASYAKGYDAAVNEVDAALAAHNNEPLRARVTQLILQGQAIVRQNDPDAVLKGGA